MNNPILVAPYTGPWYVPHKRAKKDPAAPKRNPSAFLLFAQSKRQELKKFNPGKANTDISRILGKLWRNAPIEEKRHHIEREVEERERYKISISEWRKQQETRQSAGEVESTTFSPTTTIESGIGRNMQAVIVEDNVAARVHIGDDDECDLNQRVLDDPFTSKDNYGTSLHPPRMMQNGPPYWYHQQKHMYLEYPSQEHYMHDCTHGVYPSTLRCHSPKQYRSSRPQHHGISSVNDRYFNPIPFRDKYQPQHPESHARQQSGHTNNLPMSNNNDPRYLLQNSIEQEGHVIYHWYHHQKQQQQQHHQLALEQNIAKYVSFENSDEINQQNVRDETKEVDIDMENLHYQDQNYSTQDNMKQEYANLNRQHYNQQPGEHAMDQNTPHNLSSGKLDNTQQLWASLRCGEGFISPVNMDDNREYDHAYMI